MLYTKKRHKDGMITMPDPASAVLGPDDNVMMEKA